MLILFASINNRLNPGNLYFSAVPLTKMISDLGAEYGFGIFNILLAFIGFYVAWRIKKHIVPYLILLILILASFYYTPFLLYLNPVFALFAGYSFTAFIVMRWKLPPIKFLTIMIIICGLLFSTISYIDRDSKELPNKDIIVALEWLRDSSSEKDVILSSQRNGNWIQAVSNRITVLSSNDQNQDFLNQVNELFESRNLEKTKALLEKYNVSYIFITKDMKEGGTWTKENQGLLFLFRNREAFRQIYSNTWAEIWKVNLR